VEWLLQCFLGKTDRFGEPPWRKGVPSRETQQEEDGGMQATLAKSRTQTWAPSLTACGRPCWCQLPCQAPPLPLPSRWPHVPPGELPSIPHSLRLGRGSDGEQLMKQRELCLLDLRIVRGMQERQSWSLQIRCPEVKEAILFLLLQPLWRGFPDSQHLPEDLCYDLSWKSCFRLFHSRQCFRSLARLTPQFQGHQRACGAGQLPLVHLK